MIMQIREKIVPKHEDFFKILVARINLVNVADKD